MKTIKIAGMSCEHCVKAVTRVLTEVDGIKNISVSLERNEAVFDEVGPVDYDEVKKKIEDVFYRLIINPNYSITTLPPQFTGYS